MYFPCLVALELLQVEVLSGRITLLPNDFFIFVVRTVMGEVRMDFDAVFHLTSLPNSLAAP